MGEQFSRTLGACCNPEGTAAIVRKKKAQRAALNKYMELLQGLEEALELKNPAYVGAKKHELLQYDDEVRSKQQGAFWAELQEHKDWPPIAEKRQTLEARASKELGN
eukprot:gnl/TRDRNA2_/TRDRNA2_83437_c0_seq1.p1 gnl/TRDRNA2_/TRDRNA2_83437_c0~~gnl/TRDRNA2_/TRDRNA2_83437_c0_seq1.p1  ORF type:complete len:107 (-),score=38.57 gnl/TRDRNA2_/TRDRNA2_83437_c0_seq1:95-415(-)